MEYKSYMSLTVIADKLLRHPMMSGIAYEAIIDYAIDFMRIVQCGGFFENRSTLIKIENYKGLLPQDYFEVNQIRLASTTVFPTKTEPDYGYLEDGTIVPLETVHEVFDEYNNPIYVGEPNTNGPIFKYASNTFNSEHCGYTYKIQGDYIFTSIKEGMIEINYKAVLIDSEGYPMIPDNSKFSRALEAYIKKQWFTILFDMGKIQPAIFQNVQQEYAWAVGACESEYQKMTLDKAEMFYNSWSKLLPSTKRHSRGFII